MFLGLTSLATCDCGLFHDHVTLTFDLIFFARLAAAMDYIYVNFGVDSSAAFYLKHG